MKMEALTTFMKDQPDIKKVYLLEPELLARPAGRQVRQGKHGQRKRPDVQIVGEDLHPLAQVRDFAPYIAKIKASGADTVITGNWGSDLSLLVKAANEGGYNGKFYTYYTGVTGTPTALGSGGAGRVYQVAYNHYNMGGQMQQVDGRVQEASSTTTSTPARSSTIYSVLGAGDGQGQVDRSGEGGRGDGGPEVQELQRRSRDAQDRPPAAAAAVHHASGRRPTRKYPYSAENTGMTLVPVKELRRLRGEHADQLPDEAAGLIRLQPRQPAAARVGPIGVRIGLFARPHASPTKARRWSSSPSRCSTA